MRMWFKPGPHRATLEDAVLKVEETSVVDPADCVVHGLEPGDALEKLSRLTNEHTDWAVCEPCIHRTAPKVLQENTDA